MIHKSQQTIFNKQIVESLGYRVGVLVESLCMPASRGDVKEETRRKELGGGAIFSTIESSG